MGNVSNRRHHSVSHSESPRGREAACMGHNRRCSAGCGCGRCLGRIAEVPPVAATVTFHKQLLAKLMDTVSRFPLEIANIITLYAVSPGKIAIGLGSMLYAVEVDTFRISSQVDVSNSIGALFALSNTHICVCSKETDLWSGGQGFSVKTYSLPHFELTRALAIDQDFFASDWLQLKFNLEGAWLNFNKSLNQLFLFPNRFSAAVLDGVSSTLPPQLLVDGHIVVVNHGQISIFTAYVNSASSGKLDRTSPSVRLPSQILAFAVFIWGTIVTVSASGNLNLLRVQQNGKELQILRSWQSPCLSKVTSADIISLIPLPGGLLGVVLEFSVLVLDVENQTDKLKMTHYLPIDAVCVLPDEVSSSASLALYPPLSPSSSASSFSFSSHSPAPSPTSRCGPKILGTVSINPVEL